MRFKVIRQRVVQEVLHVDVGPEDIAWLKANPVDWDEWIYEHEGELELQGQELATDMYGEPIGYSYPINLIEALPVLDQLAAIDRTTLARLDELGCVENIQAPLDSSPNSGLHITLPPSDVAFDDPG